MIFATFAVATLIVFVLMVYILIRTVDRGFLWFMIIDVGISTVCSGLIILGVVLQWG